jgi:uncharacterized membrane protein YphA (DoxX/SURF4 family)
MIVCGVLMMRVRTAGIGAVAFAAAYLLATLVFDLPRAIAHPGDITLRTLLFQPLTLAALAWTLPAAEHPNDWITLLARYSIALSLIVYGVDHFLALAGIATLVPGWIPFHVFWTAFVAVAFIAAGVSFATNILRGWAAAGLALMFTIFNVTLHIPTLLGAYNSPAAIRDPDAWCSVFIVAALSGGFLALAHRASTTVGPARLRSVS